MWGNIRLYRIYFPFNIPTIYSRHKHDMRNHFRWQSLLWFSRKLGILDNIMFCIFLQVFILWTDTRTNNRWKYNKQIIRSVYFGGVFWFITISAGISRSYQSMKSIWKDIARASCERILPGNDYLYIVNANKTCEYIHRKTEIIFMPAVYYGTD